MIVRTSVTGAPGPALAYSPLGLFSRSGNSGAHTCRTERSRASSSFSVTTPHRSHRGRGPLSGPAHDHRAPQLGRGRRSRFVDRRVLSAGAAPGLGAKGPIFGARRVARL